MRRVDASRKILRSRRSDILLWGSKNDGSTKRGVIQEGTPELRGLVMPTRPPVTGKKNREILTSKQYGDTSDQHVRRML